MNFKLTLVLLFFFVMTTSAYSGNTALIGQWETEPSPSKAGRIVINYNFMNDESFALLVTFLDVPFPQSSTEGKYTVEGNKLILIDGDKVVSLKYHFEKELLFIEEAGGTYSYSKKK